MIEIEQKARELKVITDTLCDRYGETMTQGNSEFDDLITAVFALQRMIDGLHSDIAAAVDAAYKNEIGSAKPTKARTADI